MHAHAIVGEFLFWLVPKKCAKESALSWKESNLENKSLNYKKRWKTNVWNLVLGNTIAKLFLSKNACLRQTR